MGVRCIAFQITTHVKFASRPELQTEIEKIAAACPTCSGDADYLEWMMNVASSEAIFSGRVKADGINLWLTIYPEGITLHMRPGRGRLVSHAELLRVAEGAPPDRFGVVIDGRLAMVFEEEEEANNRAADQRQVGSSATVIRVPRCVNT